MDPQIWLPIATLVLGLVLGYVGDWLRDERVSRRERETRRKNRQYEAITEAQDLIGKRFLVGHELRRAADRHFEETGLWPEEDDEFRFDADTAFESFEINHRLEALISRIEDGQLVSALTEARRHMNVMPLGGKGEGKDAVSDASACIGRFHDRARVVLKDLH